METNSFQLKEAKNKFNVRANDSKKKQTTRGKKSAGLLVWALDSTKLEAKAIEKLKTVLSVLNFKTEEVLTASVFSPFDLGWIHAVEPKLKKKTINALEERMKQQWNQLSLPFNRKSVIVSESTSIRDKVQSLIQFASKNKAHFIAVNTGAANRSSFTGIGSFTENLISNSKIPVFIFNENMRPITKVKKVLFPTDFSQASWVNFKKTILIAKNYEAEVVLYHHFDVESGPLAYGIPWGYEMNWLAEFWQAQQELRVAEGEKWKAWAAKQNVRCNFETDRKMGSLRERILEASNENDADVLVIGIKRGPWSQVILGGGVRDILAKSTCPVLAIHTEVSKKRNA